MYTIYLVGLSPVHEVEAVPRSTAEALGCCQTTGDPHVLALTDLARYAHNVGPR